MSIKWVSAASTDGNNLANWDEGGSPPSTLVGKDLVYDNTSVVNCTFTAAPGVASITRQATYTGVLSGGGFLLAASGAGITIDGTGAFDYSGGVQIDGASGVFHIGSTVGTVTHGPVTFNGTTGCTYDDDKGGLSKYLTVGASAIVTNTGAASFQPKYAGPVLILGNNCTFTNNVASNFETTAAGPIMTIGTGVTWNGSGIQNIYASVAGTVTVPGFTYSGTGTRIVFGGAYSGALVWSMTGNIVHSGTSKLIYIWNVSGAATMQHWYCNTYGITCGNLETWSYYNFTNAMSFHWGSGTHSIASCVPRLNYVGNEPGPCTHYFESAQITCAGSWKFNPGTVTVSTGSAVVSFTDTATVTCNGVYFDGVTVNAPTKTVTFADSVFLTGNFVHTAGTIATWASKKVWIGGTASFLGTHTWTGATVIVGGATCTFAAGMTLTIDASTVLILSAAANTLTTNGVTMPRIVNGAAVFPSNAQTLRVADGGPATWGHNTPGEYGPGTAVAATSNSSTSFSPSSCSDSSHSFSDSSCSDSSRSVASQSNSSDSFSIVVTTGTDSIQAQITKNIKACLKGITIANGYNYDIAMVEESRKLLDISNRWPFILLLENEPEKDDEGLVIRELSYVVWFFSKQDDRVISDPADASKDVDTEIAYYNRNAIADIAKALNVDIYRGHVDNTSHARAEITEVIHGTHDIYVDETMIMFGTWCAVRVVTNIDATNPYQLRQGV